MLEVINAPGNIRQGEAKIEFATCYQGYVTFIKGVDSDGTVVLACPNSSAQSAATYYPVKKLRFEEDLSDTSDAVDLLTSGDRVVYYEGGEFWSDRMVARNAIGFGRALPAATAYTRFVDTIVHTVVPTTALYPVYWGDRVGQLIATAVGTSAATGEQAANAKFRLMEAWGGTAASVDRGTAIKARVKVVPGFVGQKF